MSEILVREDLVEWDLSMKTATKIHLETSKNNYLLEKFIKNIQQNSIVYSYTTYLCLVPVCYDCMKSIKLAH